MGGERVFSRGGAVLYGRAEFARRFDFRDQSLLYFVNGLSESACFRLFKKDCEQVSFLAENTIGNDLAAAGASDEMLMLEGKRLLLQNPIRQAAFVLFEWSKLLLHHGTAGFARLEAPLAGPILHSLPITLLLKVANIALLLLFAWALCCLPARWQAGTAAQLPFFLGALYLGAYLLVYGFATTVIRMAYPVAPLLLVFSWEAFRQRWIPGKFSE